MGHELEELVETGLLEYRVGHVALLDRAVYRKWTIDDGAEPDLMVSPALSDQVATMLTQQLSQLAM
jgi:hypothetical protein